MRVKRSYTKDWIQWSVLVISFVHLRVVRVLSGVVTSARRYTSVADMSCVFLYSVDCFCSRFCDSVICIFILRSFTE